MNFTFLDSVLQHEDQHLWEVTSRGTDAHRDDPMCQLGSRVIKGLPGGADFARLHRARVFTARFASTQDLVLTATRDERGLIGFLAPAMRPKTFTLREAIWLGRAELGEAELSRVVSLLSGGTSQMQTYADLLHRRRGVTPFQRESRGAAFWFRRTERHALDITDRHSANARAHAESLSQIQEFTKIFARQLLGGLTTIDRTGPSGMIRSR